MTSTKQVRAPVDRRESLALSLVRTLADSEGTYATFNGGYYDTLECLTAVRSCVPGVADMAPFLHGPSFEWDMKLSGYRFVFHPGPKVEPPDGWRPSPSAMSGFAFTAYAVGRDMEGLRSFCVDDWRFIYVTPSGTAPRVENAKCVDRSHMLDDEKRPVLVIEKRH